MLVLAVESAGTEYLSNYNIMHNYTITQRPSPAPFAQYYYYYAREESVTQ